MHDFKPMQDRLHKDNPIRICYGCGADNERGLQLKSRVEGDELVAEWCPEPKHQAYPGYLNGGVAATLIDCHAAWAAFVSDCEVIGVEPESRAETLPAGWTRAMNIEYLKPTPIDKDVTLRAKVVKKGTKSRTVTCSLYSGEDECVKAEVTIVVANL